MMPGVRPTIGGSPRLFCLFVLGLLAGCVSPPYAHRPLPDTALEAHWSAYRASLGERALQPACEPLLVRPGRSTPVRGAVLLFHGFNACPQQYLELAGLLAEHGYLAVAPLLPGHGTRNPGLEEDDLRALSTGRTWRRDYDELVLRMNDLMRSVPGERVLVGLSVGSATALHASLADPALYQRILLFSPFLGPPGGGAAEALTGTLGRLAPFGEISFGALGWRELCVPKRRAGRGGYCDYRLKHVVGITALARSVRQRLGGWSPAAAVQLVAVDEDPSVSEVQLARFIDETLKSLPEASHCLLADDVMHSMLSRFDHPGLDMYWLPATLEHTLAFIAAGSFFPRRAEAVALGPLCRIPPPGPG